MTSHATTDWLAAHTGMRRGELIGLRWRDVELDKARLSIVRTVICVGARMQEAGGKTPNAARTIDLDTATLGLLTDWRAEHTEHFGGDDPDRWVFAKPDGTLLHPQSLSQAFDRAVAAAAVPKISLHGLRHTHATLLHLRGVASAASFASSCDPCGAWDLGLWGFTVAA